MQSLKGLNTGTGSQLVAGRGARCTPDSMGPLGLYGGEGSYTKDLAGVEWVCVIVYMNTHLFTNTQSLHLRVCSQSLHLRPDVLIHTQQDTISSLQGGKKPSETSTFQQL